MSIDLGELERCFMGATPASIATCSADGVPNITFLSIVHRVDDSHVALSFQFFNKTRQNILSNPRAHILLPHPKTMEQYRIDAVYERTERDGPVFERMRVNLDAVASQCGMQDVFRLQGADIYRVKEVEKLARDLDLTEPDGSTNFVAALETLSTRLSQCDELEPLLETTLKGLAELFDYPHSLILLADETGRRLYTVASHGFSDSGVGAELAVGEGLIGTAAQERRTVRVANLHAERMLAEAIHSLAQAKTDSPSERREIPLPGLRDTRCQIATPLFVRDRLLGVLCVQSPVVGRLTMEDEQALGTLARYLATSIQLIGQTAGVEPPAPARPAAVASGTPLVIRHHESDDSIFVDGEYLIKGLPGRIFMRLLTAHEKDGRVDFTNKELRVDRTLQLAEYRDNLEARLILLRRRLEERIQGVRLTKSGRGRFRLDLERPVTLVKAP